MNVVWRVGLAVLLVYVLLALLPPRPVGVRLSSLGGLALLVAALRLLLVPFGSPVEGAAEWAALGGTLAAGVGLSLCRRIWIVRATVETLGEQVRWACKGLCLNCAEEKQAFVVSHKQVTQRLRRVSLSRNWQLLVLPQCGASAKVALFVGWLSKQYAGPFPRVRLVLKKE
jgi:hypothetical protein